MHYIDLQVNGYSGIDFCDARLQLDDIVRVTQMLQEQGTAGYLATIITGPISLYESVLPTLARAMKQPSCRDRLLGIHLEGPFLSPEPGAIGAHPAEHVKLPDITLLDKLQQLAEGNIRLLTVAPEMPGACDLIRHATSQGIAVSLGHTLAGSDDVRRAVDAGATLSTHLGNGLPQMIHRHENPIFAQLATPELTAMLITDGHHLPDDFIRVVTEVKGPERLIITSDSTSVAGQPPGIYECFGIQVQKHKDGSIRPLDRDGLAGSAAVMRDCVEHFTSLDLVHEAHLQMITHDNPLQAIGR